MSIPFRENAAQNQFGFDEFSVNFIGKELFYSDQTLTGVETEFGVTTHRYDSISALPTYGDPTTGPGRIVIVDQMILEDLLARPRHYRDCVGSGSLAYAYRKEESARFLFEQWDRTRHGDIGFLPMNVGPDVWRAILRLLLHEELYLPGFLADSVSNLQSPPKQHAGSTPAAPEPHPLYSKLTRREKQVLQQVSKGHSNKIIAANLGITEHTVKLHMHNVAGKIGVSNRTAAAQFFFEVAPDEAHELASD
ncbi:helix-turn-helix transcriptional regulator [Ruegeria lacuscaerulensis]|uniref:helix-turn-helix transcriptional regulator n=1 Tax=Ruegeria lacuscaerulensis TaxID=55218 RepID=UPI001F357F72|nr:response regulator transcription factor [Ruegeria lacuscaerulensis]